MMKIITQGNLFESNADTLVNAVNCVGVMGKGIALTFKKRYPAMFDEYRARCDQGLLRPGVLHLYKDPSGITILNFPTKDHWREKADLLYIEAGLAFFRKHHRELEIRSAAFPALGCGLGGLRWDDVRPMMEHYLGKLPIDVEIFEPVADITAPR